MPTIDDCLAGVETMAAVIPFFPQTNSAKGLIAGFLLHFVSTNEQLGWFIGAACENLTKYEGGPALRALFCTKFPPADGLLPVVVIPGFSSTELEQQFEQRQAVENEQRFNEYKRERGLAPPEDREPFQLPAGLAAMPDATAEDKIAAAKFLRERNLPIISSGDREPAAAAPRPEDQI